MVSSRGDEEAQPLGVYATYYDDITAEQRASEVMTQAAERNQRLYALTAALARALGAVDVAEVIIQEGLAALDANAGAIFLLDDAQASFQAIAFRGYPEELVPSHVRVAVDTPGPLNAALITRDIVTVESPEEMLARWPSLAPSQQESGDTATAAIPLLLDDQPLGVLYIAFRTRRTFSADDRAFLATLGRQCAQALDRARLYDAAERARNAAERANLRVTFLAEASVLLADSLDPQATLDTLAHLVVPRLADWCVVDVVSDEGAIETAIVAHADPEKEAIGRALTQRYPIDPNAPSGTAAVLRTRQPELMSVVQPEIMALLARDAEHLQSLQDLRIASTLCVPLVARGRALGTIALISSTPGCYSEKDVSFMEELARRAAVAMDNARLYRAQQEAIAARDIFLSVAAHELRTPLTSLQGFAQHLLRRAKREGYMPERDQHNLEVIVTQVERLSRLIETLLDVSRIQLDRLQLDRTTINLSELAAGLVAEIAPTLDQHTLTLQGATEPLFVEGDALRLEQVLHNLISNAVKYSLEGGPVTVTLARDEQWARIEVRDQGIGIPTADQGQLFQRFGRVTSPATRHIAGMGVGLYLVKEIVTRHGGEVWVESVEGQGSTFTVRLPLRV